MMAKKKKAKKAAKRRPAKPTLGLKQLLKEIDRRIKTAEKLTTTGRSEEDKAKARKAVEALRQVRSMTRDDDCPFEVMLP
jgi:hypothetical protein